MMIMEIQLLREEEILPEKEVIAKALQNAHEVFEEFTDVITNPDFQLTPEWNYYKDGKAWLCKITFKKKTVCWLSVWNGFFKTSFFFTDKNSSGVIDLEINNTIKEDFKNAKPIGRLIPLVLSISKQEEIEDALKIIEYKKSLK